VTHRETTETTETTESAQSTEIEASLRSIALLRLTYELVPSGKAGFPGLRFWWRALAYRSLPLALRGPDRPLWWSERPVARGSLGSEPNSDENSLCSLCALCALCGLTYVSQDLRNGAIGMASRNQAWYRAGSTRSRPEEQHVGTPKLVPADRHVRPGLVDIQSSGYDGIQRPSPADTLRRLSHREVPAAGRSRTTRWRWDPRFSGVIRRAAPPSPSRRVARYRGR
jgi:hypothetical protein